MLHFLFFGGDCGQVSFRLLNCLLWKTKAFKLYFPKRPRAWQVETNTETNFLCKCKKLCITWWGILKVTPLLSQPDESASENLHTLSSQYQETLTTDCRPWNAGGYKTQTRYKKCGLWNTLVKTVLIGSR